MACPGAGGARTSASASGARSARTTAPTATPGTTSPHDQARSRAYRWGEDGLAGICDDQQRLCFALALWNGQRPDPQGAAVRPDRTARATTARTSRSTTSTSTPRRPTRTCAACYKYPQAAYPVRRPRRDEPGRATRSDLEYELLDTGVFDDDRYFDVEVEYAKASPDDIADPHHRRTTAAPEAAPLHVLPTLWFRNTWSWGDDARRPSLAAPATAGRAVERAAPGRSAPGALAADGDADAAVHARTRPTSQRLFGGANRTPVRQGRHQRPRRPRRGGRGQPRAAPAPRPRRTSV